LFQIATRSPLFPLWFLIKLIYSLCQTLITNSDTNSTDQQAGVEENNGLTIRRQKPFINDTRYNINKIIGDTENKVHQFEMEMRVQVNFNMQLMLRTAGDRVYLHIKTLVIKMGVWIEGGGSRVEG